MKAMRRILSLCLVFIMIFSLSACKSDDYEQACALLEDEDYEEALDIFEELGDYEDSKTKAEECKKIIDTKTALEEGLWFFGDTNISSNAIKLVFDGNKATITTYYFDGNGKHEDKTTTKKYKITSDKIIIPLDGYSLEIPYSLDNNTLLLQGDFFTPEQIKKSLTGYWTADDYVEVLYDVIRSQYTIRFTENTIKYESATQSSLDEYEYFYYGPYSGTYEITENGLETNVHNGAAFNFTIRNGKVLPLRYNELLTASSSHSFPGESGYEF